MATAKKHSPYGPKKFKTVDEYLQYWPVEKRKHLDKIREIIKKVTPDSTELISYNMPAIKGHKLILYYAAHTAHAGIYPIKVPPEIQEEIAAYQTSVGTLQFPYDQKLPVQLLRRLVQLRVKQDAESRKK